VRCIAVLDLGNWLLVRVTTRRIIFRHALKCHPVTVSFAPRQDSENHRVATSTAYVASMLVEMNNVSKKAGGDDQIVKKKRD
jgi:hypothetical protein